MDLILEGTLILDVLATPLDYITSDGNVQLELLPSLFENIAEVLFEGYDVVVCDCEGEEHSYAFAEIEFYYHKKGVVDGNLFRCAYPRTCEAGKFLFNDSGVDLCFESNADIDDYYFGGILIRSLIDKDNQIIGGPGRCANELDFHCRKDGAPQLRKRKKVEVKINKTIRQGIDCDVDKDGHAIENFCYYIDRPKEAWTRTKVALVMTKDCNFKGYKRKKVTYTYADNPTTNRAKKIVDKRNKKQNL